MIIHVSRCVRNGIGVMRAQTVQTTVVVQAGHYPGNGLPRSIQILSLVSESGVPWEVSRVGVQRCAVTPHGCRLHPIRRAVEGGSQQETSVVFGSRRDGYPHCCTVSHAVAAPMARQRLRVCRTSSCHGIHFSSSCSVYRASSCGKPCRGIHFSCSVRCTSFCGGVHRSSTSGKLRRASAYRVCTSHQHWRELQRIYRCNRDSSSLALTSRFGLHAECAGYQEAAYCQFGWEPYRYRKKSASSSDGESSGDFASVSQPSTCLRTGCSREGRAVHLGFVGFGTSAGIVRTCLSHRFVFVLTLNIEHSPEGQQHY